VFKAVNHSLTGRLRRIIRLIGVRAVSRGPETAPNRSPTVERIVKALVCAWLDGPDPHDLGPMVRETSALPVYTDMGGTLFIRPDGEILLLCLNSNEAPQIERDPVWRLTAVVAAAEKYPELRVLLPIRDDNAIECQSCGGRGRVSIFRSELRCGDCCGLGWLTHERAEAIRAAQGIGDERSTTSLPKY
jgi:hypothetical protein